VPSALQKSKKNTPPPYPSQSTLDFFLAKILPFCHAFLSAFLPSFVPLVKVPRVKEGKNPCFISAQPNQQVN
tara:strand:+ start:65 stop:280 length:216 start_codon:yes stop_codon:yes gene_type:complete